MKKVKTILFCITLMNSCSAMENSCTSSINETQSLQTTYALIADLYEAPSKSTLINLSNRFSNRFSFAAAHHTDCTKITSTKLITTALDSIDKALAKRTDNCADCITSLKAHIGLPLMAILNAIAQDELMHKEEEITLILMAMKQIQEKAHLTTIALLKQKLQDSLKNAKSLNQIAEIHKSIFQKHKESTKQFAQKEFAWLIERDALHSQQKELAGEIIESSKVILQKNETIIKNLQEQKRLQQEVEQLTTKNENLMKQLANYSIKKDITPAAEKHHLIM
jgi:hypothetical protein